MDFTQQFQTCVDREGSEYIAARTALLADGVTARPQLEAKLAASNWREQLAAQILIGWIDQRPLFERVAAIVKGHPTGPRAIMPITGVLAVADRVATLAHEGPVVVPRLLEMLLKTGEYISSDQLQAITQTLELLGDERSVLPLADLIGRPTNDQARAFALNTLGSMRDARAFDAIQATFASQENDTNVRAAAAVALGLLADWRATAPLLAALRDPTEDEDVRRHIVRGLGYLGDPAAAPVLAALLRNEQPPELALTIVQALGKLGGSDAITALADAGSTHTDATVRRAAVDAQRQLIA